jgi:hypothetical protein
VSITDRGSGVKATDSSARLAAVAEVLASFVAGLDIAAMSGAEAATLTECFAKMSRLAVAGMTLAAGRVAETGHHRVMGFPTAARWLADRTKASRWEAARTIETATQVAAEALGATRDALVAGALTATQANEIATATARAPDQQEALLSLASRETVAQLESVCRRVRLAGKEPEDPEKRRKRVVGEMAFGHRDLGDGMSEMFARMPTSWLVLVVAAVRQQCEAVFAKARAEGRDDPHQAYMVEALVTLLLLGDLTGTRVDAPGPFDGAASEAADARDDEDDDQDRAEEDDDEDDDGKADEDEPSDAAETGVAGMDDLYDQLLAAIRGVPPPPRTPRRERRAARRGRCRCGGRVVPRAKIIVRADLSALRRGHAEGDEVCDIAGVGPVTVATVRQLWPDAVVKAVITRGVDVLNVTSLGRRATEAMATAMQFANPACSNIACDNARFVEIDHRLGYANVGRTRLDELDPLCSCCHSLKTNENWQLVAGTGRRRFVPHGHPDHPGDPPTPSWRPQAAMERPAG